MNNSELRKLIRIVEFNEDPIEIVYVTTELHCDWELGDIRNPGPTHVKDPYGLKGNYLSLNKQPGPNDAPIIKSFLNKVMTLAKHYGWVLSYADGSPYFGADSLGLQYDKIGRGPESVKPFFNEAKDLQNAIFEVVENYEDRLEINEVYINIELRFYLSDNTTMYGWELELTPFLNGQMKLTDLHQFKTRDKGWGNLKVPGPGKDG